MKITILGNRDLACCIALNRLLPGLTEHDVTLFLSARVGSNSARPQALQHLAFCEQTLFNDLLFPALASSGHSQSGCLLDYDQLGERTGKPVRELNRINATPELEQFKRSEPELVISIRYGVILKEPVLEVPSCGVINLHSGLLPAYQGVMATFRAMLNGDEEIGTTLHYIDDSSIDTGRIIATSRLKVQVDRSYLWHVLALYAEGCELIIDAVNAIDSSGSVPAVPQQGSGAYYSFPDEKELALFFEKGFTLVDSDDLVEIASRFMSPCK